MSNIEHEKIRNIILLETDKNKKGDLFNRLAYDVFHALGFGEPQFNIPKSGREIDRICFANQLRTFVATYPNVHLIITSREAGFRAVTGTIATYCKQYFIRGLEEVQIRLLSLKWH